MLAIRDVPTVAELRRLKKLVPAVPPEVANLAIRLVSTVSRAFERLEGYLAREGMSFGRVAVLLQLLRFRDTGLTPSELADKLGVTRATVTGLIDRLQREGLVERARHPSDRRSHHVHMTAGGFTKLATVLPPHAVRVSLLMKGLDAKERKQLARILEKLDAAIDKLPEA